MLSYDYLENKKCERRRYMSLTRTETHMSRFAMEHIRRQIRGHRRLKVYYDFSYGSAILVLYLYDRGRERLSILIPGYGASVPAAIIAFLEKFGVPSQIPPPGYYAAGEDFCWVIKPTTFLAALGFFSRPDLLRTLTKEAQNLEEFMVLAAFEKGDQCSEK